MPESISQEINTNGFFKYLFDHAAQNNILIMTTEGAILAVNQAFTSSLGYSNADVSGRNHRMLFTPEDQKRYRPESELETVLLQHHASDDCYLVHKDGSYIWVNGESLLVANDEDQHYIVKVIHDIHSHKLLEKYLSESNRFIDMIFDSVQDTALLVVDQGTNIIKWNGAFLRVFNLESTMLEGTLLQDLQHPFWQGDKNRLQLKETIRSHKAGNQAFSWNEEGQDKMVNIQFKPLEIQGGINNRILLIITV